MYEVYTVRSEDTLSSISSNYGMNENELRRINGFSPIYEVVDSSLIVVPVRGKRNYQYYTVKKGNTIFMGNNEYEKIFEENLSKSGLRFAFTMV